MRTVILYGVILTLVLGSCSKPSEPVDPVDPIDPRKDPGVVNGTINGKPWEPNEYEAVYYPKWNQVVIYAKVPQNTMTSDNGAYDLSLVVDIDSLSPLKSYQMEPNGPNSAKLKNFETEVTSSHNMADAGGSFTLEKLDTVKKSVSCSFNFVSYNGDKTKRLDLKNGTMKDITLWIDKTSYDGDYLQVDIRGVKNTSWKAKNFITRAINCSSTLRGPTLTVAVSTRVGSRVLQFDIPLQNGKGTFFMFPSFPPYSFCGEPYNRSFYQIIDFDKQYYSRTGTITISHLDLVKKELVATFNATYSFKDTVANKETIQMTNGVIRAHNWKDL
jgi:hypothetical protein